MKLKIEGLSISFDTCEILQGVTLSLDPGQIVGLIGPNGSGKSTFLRALNGFIPGFSGNIHIGEEEIRNLKASERARRVTYVGAELETDFPLTAREFVALGEFSLGETSGLEERVRTVMEETGCWDYRSRFLNELSSGERQRAHFARALLQRSKWICLDESFSRLDLHHQAQIGALLRKYVTRGYSFLFVSHDLNFTTDWADRCILLRKGELVAEGATSEVVNTSNLRKLYPDADIVLTPHPVSGALKVYFRG